MGEEAAALSITGKLGEALIPQIPTNSNNSKQLKQTLKNFTKKIKYLLKIKFLNKIKYIMYIIKYLILKVPHENSNSKQFKWLKIFLKYGHNQIFWASSPHSP